MEVAFAVSATALAVTVAALPTAFVAFALDAYRVAVVALCVLAGAATVALLATVAMWLMMAMGGGAS